MNVSQNDDSHSEPDSPREPNSLLGSFVTDSVLSRNCLIETGSVIEKSIIGHDVIIGRNCRIKRAIIDAHNNIPDNTVIGEDPEEDARNYYMDPKSGLVVLGIPRIYYQKGFTDDTDNTTQDDETDPLGL